jgi:Na+:H+ antiporter, NhaA family
LIGRFFFQSSGFLIVGSLLGLLWANVAQDAYRAFVEFALLESVPFGELHHGRRTVTVHYAVNDILMALFFSLAGKEVWEAVLPGGPLERPRQAAAPLLATLGGMVGPASVYLLGAALIGRFAELSAGWAIPCATDIAFSYMVARFVFGLQHPAIPFLLLLAIADDALGLVILALFYPQEPIVPGWLLLPAGAVVMGIFLQRLGCRSFWIYLLGPGVASWIGFAWAGLHPALALLPVIPTLPHAHTDLGIFMSAELLRKDTLSEYEHFWKKPVELILGLFGLANAGVVLGSAGEPTLLVLCGLLIGKPLGIFLFGWVASKVLGFGLPEGMAYRDLLVVGFAAGIGFTVALFVSVVAFPSGEVQDAARMGALASLGAGLLTIVVARLSGVPAR